MGWDVNCPFCAFIHGDAQRPDQYTTWGDDFVYFEPIDPVTPGHLLVVPVEHVQYASGNFTLTGKAFENATRIAGMYGHMNYNLIVNRGRHAGQTVPHLHVHIVPRRAGDGLLLPWGGVG